MSEASARRRVLFICTANSARSQMAEGWLRELAGDRFDVYSGGLEPGTLHPLAVEAMKERGIDISGQHAKSFDRYLGKVSFAFVITVCDRAARECPVFAGTGERLHWSFEDPAAAGGSKEQKLAKFREVRDALEARVRDWLATLLDAAEGPPALAASVRVGVEADPAAGTDGASRGGGKHG